MFVGAPLWTFDRDMDKVKAMNLLVKAGCQSCEMIIWDEPTLVNEFSDAQVKDYKAALDASGLILSQFVISVDPVTSEDPAIRANTIEVFKKGVDIAARLGTKNVNFTAPYPFAANFPELRTLPQAQVFSMGIDMNRDWDRNYKELIETMHILHSFTSAYGLRLLTEPHPHRWVDDTTSFLYLYEKVGLKDFGINFDTNHAFACGEMVQNAPYRLREKIGHIHVSDNNGQFNAHWMPRKGKIDWKEFMKALIDINYDGAISIEAVGKADPDVLVEEIRDTVQYFQRIAKSLGGKID